MTMPPISTNQSSNHTMNQPINQSMPDRPLKRMSEQGRKALQGSQDFPIRPVDPVHPAPRESRDQIEKGRLIDRVENFTRYVSINESIKQSTNQSKRPNAGIHQSVVDAPMFGDPYQPINQRYDSNIILEQKNEKYATHKSINQSINQRRARADQYEKDRWQKMSEESTNQSIHQRNLQSSTTANKKNEPSIAIDIINQSYQSNNAGMDLQSMDQSIKYRAACRSHNLDRLANSSINPITNQPRKSFPEPTKPPRRSIDQSTNQPTSR